ncbi:MAG TPA: hypothetical protein PK954_11930 [Anaerolineales bacterium]|mgnify:CR=1 FL=1|nr:hypothetical protein [Anaerolineales bacterium]
MITLLEILFVLLVGGARQALPRIPGATYYEILPSRQVMHEDAPAFTGIVHIVAGEQLIGADCSFLPYWEGEIRYPCWPQRIAVAADEPVTFWLDGDADGEVMLTVRVIGYANLVWLPEVAR